MAIQLESIGDRSLHEICSGVAPMDSGEGVFCLVCGAQFELGRIYPFGDVLYQAEKAVRYHLEMEHDGMLNVLLNLEKKDHGLTDNQKEMIGFFMEGQTDTAIAEATRISKSTVRNYRFSLRERAKQAKFFLAIWHLVERQAHPGERLIPFPASTTMRDDRLLITEQENRDIIEAYFDKAGQKLKHFPRKQKKKAAILRHIMLHFDSERSYQEKEVNEILKIVYADFVTLRRYLIDYGFLDREKNGSSYWVKKVKNE